MSPERRGGDRRRRRASGAGAESSEPINPIPLPPELGEFLLDKDVACVTAATDQGTMLVVKVPAREIASVRGRVPISLRHELYEHPAAPVIRLVTTIYDQPDSALALETFINVADEAQLTDYALLTQQDELTMLFYDEKLRHRLSKRVALSDPDLTTLVLANAIRLAQRIPPEQYDFDAAKKAVMERTKL